MKTVRHGERWFRGTTSENLCSAPQETWPFSLQYSGKLDVVDGPVLGTCPPSDLRRTSMIAPVDHSRAVPRTAVQGKKKKILLIDDHPITRAGLVALVAGESDLTVCGESDGTEAIKLARSKRPDVVVLDLVIRGASGFDLVADLRNLEKPPAILVFSMLPEQMLADRALQLGAAGYVMKDSPASTFVNALREVLSGRTYVSDKMLSEVGSRLKYLRPNEATFSVNDLVDREAAVLRLFGLGYIKPEIAAQLCTTETEVKICFDHLKRKLGLPRLDDLFHFAVQRMRTEAGE